MAFQRVPETAFAKVVFEANNQELSCGFHATLPGGYSQSDLDALAGAVDHFAGEAFRAVMVTSHQYLRTEVTGLDSETDLSSLASAYAGAGSESVNALPNNVSFVVSQDAGLTGRTTRGRLYMPPIPRTYVYTTADNYDVLLSTAVTNYVSTAAVVRASINLLTGWQATLVSRFHNGSKRAEAVTYAWLNTYANSDKVASRRGRLHR